MFNISLKQPDPGFNVILFQDDATTSTGYTLTGVLGLNVSLLTGSYSGSAGFNPNVIDLEVSLLGGQTDYGINYSSDVAGLVVSLTGDASSFTPISTGYTATGLFELGISFIGTGSATTSGSVLYSGENPLFLTVSMSGASGSATTGDVEVGSAASFSGSVIPLNISLLTGSVSFGTGVSISGSPLLLVVNNTGSSFSAGLNISSDLLIISGSIPAATGSGGANYSGTSPSILNLSLLEPSASTAESPTIRRYAGDRFTCLSTDTKPLDVTDGALLHVLDTRYSYLKVSGAWIETSASWSGAGGSSGSYTDEQAQDAVGSIMTGLSGINVSYTDGSNSITITYTGNAGVDLTNEPILVTEAPDFLSNYYVLTAGSGISILNNSFASTISVTNWTGLTGHLNNTSNPHSVTASQVGAPTVAQFTGHTGDASIHFTQASISISASQISDFSEAVDDRVSVLVVGQSGIGVAYNDGTGLLTVTYTGNINTFTPVDYRQATGNIIPGTDVTYNLGTFPLRWNNVYSRVFTAGDTPSTVINDDVTTAHIIASGDDSDPTLRIYPYVGSAGNNAEFYTTSGNLGVGIDYLGNVRVNGSITISGGMITGVIIPTASGHAVNKFYVDNAIATISGFDHGNASGLLDDDHTIYIHKNPSSVSRNDITPIGDYPGLTIYQSASEPPLYTNIFSIKNTALIDKLWFSPENVLSVAENPTGLYGVPNLTYLSSNYSTLAGFNSLSGKVHALSGSYTGFTGSVGTAAFANIGTGNGQVASGMDPRFLSLAKKEQLSFTKVSWWQHGTSNWTSSVSGTATAYLGQQRYTTQFQSNNVDPYSVTDCTNNISGNAAVRYMNNRMIWMSDGRYYKVRAAHTYTGSIRANRVGFYGNDTNPTSNSSPTAGLWFEYSNLTGQTWCAKSCAGGSTGTVDLGITASTNTWFELMFRYWISGNTTGVSYYAPSSSGEAVIGTITGAQVPTSAAQRQGTFFQQIIRHTGVPTNYPATQVEYFAMSDATGNWTYANAFS